MESRKFQYEDIVAIKGIIAILKKFFYGDDAKIEWWLNTRNPLLGDLTPMRMIETGRAPKLLHVMESWE